MRLTIHFSATDTDLKGVPEAIVRDVYKALVDFTHPNLSDAAVLKRVSDQAGVQYLEDLSETLIQIGHTNTQNRGFTLELRKSTQMNTLPLPTQTVAVQSTSNPSTFHTVKMVGKKAIECNCLGFMHRQSCKHLSLAEKGQTLFHV